MKHNYLWIPAFAGMTIFCCSLTLFAALRLGLGSAVAKRSAELIDKAAAEDPANAVGYAVAATLPSCPTGAIYDSLPTDLSMIGGIDPLGHVAPSPHTFPSDHIYFYATTTTVVTPPVYSPGNIHIVTVIEGHSSNGSITDYSLYFYPCRELKSYFFHVKTLTASLLARIGAINQNCTSYVTGGITYNTCSNNVNITLQPGELIGYSNTSGAFDFGTYDYRQTPLPFLVPSRHYGDQPYTACPLDYFSSGLKTQMEALLGRADGGYRRVTPPMCGQINFDIAGSAKGHWYHPGSPNNPEDPHLALIDNNVYAPDQVISFGSSLPNAVPNWLSFSPGSGGVPYVNQDLSSITVDGHIYCYDHYFDPAGNTSGGGPTVLIQLTNATTLRFEWQGAAACGVGPWAFTSNAVDFQR